MTTIADQPGYGRYELLARIGEGPRGPVFVARIQGDASAEPRYVVELSAFATGEDEPLRTFNRDVACAARISHRNVVGIVDTGVNSAGHYVVMDYLEGCTLAELQDRHRAIRPPRLVLTTIIDGLHGLHAAHALHVDGAPRPLLHGSVSPDSLVLGLDGVSRVTGFGNVRPRVQTKPSHRTRTAIGYMAPEQLTGGEVDHRADVFSMGVVLWNALTGKKLFHDRIEHLTMSNVLERKAPRPSMVGLAPPPALDAVVLKALERTPARRFQDAAELAAALHDVARGAGCLAAATEVSEWITTTFGSELAARRRVIRELVQRPRRTSAEVSVLAPLGGVQAAEAGADELSTDELARAADPVVPEPATTVAPAAWAATPIARSGAPARLARNRLAIVGVAAFAVVALVLGWRWSRASTAAPGAAALAGAGAPRRASPPATELEVTVLEVRSVAAEPVAPTATSTMRLDPPAPAAPGRPPARPKKPARSGAAPRSGEARAEPADARPAEARPDPAPPPAPTRPEAPARPTLESNPYLYK